MNGHGNHLILPTYLSTPFRPFPLFSPLFIGSKVTFGSNTSISHNRAGIVSTNVGGALYIDNSVASFGIYAIINNNTAPEGAVFYIAGAAANISFGM